MAKVGSGLYSATMLCIEGAKNARMCIAFTGRLGINISRAGLENICILRKFLIHHGRIQRGDRGYEHPPLKNHKNIGFSSNTDPDLLKNLKASNPAFNIEPSLARQRNAI